MKGIKTLPGEESHIVADIVIIGTGIHGMHLFRRIGDDSSLRGRRIVTIDPFPDPFVLWRTRSANCGMTHLRSPASHGLNPHFPTIRRFAAGRGEHRPFIPPYHRPSLELFNAHIDHEIITCAAHRAHVTATVTNLECADRSVRISAVSAGGVPREIRSSSVILAVGNPPPLVPTQFVPGISAGLPIYHVYDKRVDTATISHSARVVIVGGGIAAAHLALSLQERGTTVTLWNRDPLVPEQFDSDPCYIGPRCGAPFRRTSDCAVRRQIIDEARRPGSVPPDLYERLNGAVTRAKVTLFRGAVEGVAGSDSKHPVELIGNDNGKKRTAQFDTVILSTGFQPMPPQEQLIQETARLNMLPLAADGFPILNASLRWAGHGNTTRPALYCAGALAELEIGPPSRNIIGAHLAGRRIVPDLVRLFTR